MNRKEWNEGLNHLDYDLVEKYVAQKDKIAAAKKRNNIWIRVGATAACLILAIGSILAASMRRNDTSVWVNSVNGGASNSNMILEVDNGQYGIEAEVNHGKMVSDAVQFSIDDTVPVERTLVINDVEHSLQYKDTLFYPVGGRRVHRYFVDGDENNAILLDNEGNINSILYEYTKLNISKTAFPEEVLEPLKAELSKVIDISYYKEVRMPTPSEDTRGFGMYKFLFYNQKNNYMTDYLGVAVSDDGSVFGLKNYPLPNTDFNVDISKDKEQNAIELKLKDIYNTDVTNYQSYNMESNPSITIYEHQLYVKYAVSVNYIHAQYGETSSWLHTLLIPLDLLNN